MRPSALGYFRVQHIAVNKAKQSQPYTLAAHSNYAANSNRCSDIVTVNMPTNRHAIYRILTAHEKELKRVNAHIGDKLIVSFDVRMNEAHRRQAARRYLQSLTAGRSRAAGFFHDMQGHNPHMHVVLLDLDIETGKSVHKMSANRTNRTKAGLEPNVVEWVRKEWEKECNAVLESHGYEFRVDRRSNYALGLDAPGEHLKPGQLEAVNDNARKIPREVKQPPVDIPPPEHDVETLPVDEPETADEDEVAVVTAKDKAEAVARASDYKWELGHLRNVQAKLELAEKLVASNTSALETAQAASADAIGKHSQAEKALNQATLALTAYIKDNGKLRGFEVGFGRFKFASPTRRAGNQALDKVHSLTSSMQAAETSMREFEHKVQHYASQKEAAEFEQASAREAANAITAQYGEKVSLEEAERTLTYNMHRELQGIEPGDLQEMMFDGMIGEGEYLDALELLGTPEARHLIAEYREEGLSHD